MNVLVAGATGLIGRALLLRLAGDGHRITALVRSPGRARQFLERNVRLLGYDQGMDPLIQALGQSRAVVNLAGAPIFSRPWSSSRKRELIESRVGVTRTLVDAIQRADPRPEVLLSASAVGYYGGADQGELDESGPAGDGFLARLCFDWEKAARRVEELGVRLVIPRIGVVLGLGGGVLQSLLPVFRGGLGGPLGRGDQIMPWIHLEDLAEILNLLISDRSLEGVFNAVAPRPVSNREFSDTLGQVVKRPAVLRTPGFAIRTALGEAASAVLLGQRVVPRKLLRQGYAYRHESLKAALQDLLPGNNPDIGPVGRVPQAAYLQKRKPRFRLVHKTSMARPLTEVFPFFADARNVGVITPPQMSFEFLSDVPEEIQAGTEIEYRIRLGQAPVRWKTRIESFEPGVRFVDCQLKGPYRSWYHEHRFASGNGHTAMEDLVYYSPPLGLLGDLANRMYIRTKLADIFRYRALAIRLRFSGQGSS